MEGQIFTLLPKIMAAVGFIGKEQENAAQHYRFRGIDQVLTKLSAALLQHSCMVSCKMLAHKVEHWVDDKMKDKYHATLTMEMTFFAPDGSSIVNSMAGEALDTNGDKATAKALAQAFKYGAFLGLVLPVTRGLIPDSDRAPKGKPDDKPPKEIDVIANAVRGAKSQNHIDKMLERAREKLGAKSDDYFYILEVATETAKQFAGTTH